MNKFEAWHQEQEAKFKARQEAAARERREKRRQAQQRPARPAAPAAESEAPAAE